MKAHAARRPAPFEATDTTPAYRCYAGYVVRVALTPAQQRIAVSEGMALGLVICGRDVLPFDKARLDAAFEGAWRSWPHHGSFPQVTTDLADGEDGVWAMTGADSRKEVWALYWEQDGDELRIRARQPDWSPEDPADLTYAAEVIDGDVPVASWEVLAREFLLGMDS